MDSNIIELTEEQLKALRLLRTGSLLYGLVGSGKTIVSLAWWWTYWRNKDLYVITTAKKRDTQDFFTDAKAIGITKEFIVDSWNNIGKYVKVTNACFIFDEQRTVGYGTWSKDFIKIAKFNEWILCSGTPGDTWMDYMSLFIANGYYHNKTEFIRKHVIYNRFSNFPKIDKYINEDVLLKYRNQTLVKMVVTRLTNRNKIYIQCNYPKEVYKKTEKNVFDYTKNEPIQNASQMVQALRRLCATDHSRTDKVSDIIDKIPKLIIFYNYDYELNLLRYICKQKKVSYAEWNGHKHQDIPIESEQWIYLVQYTAGQEGWNCVETDSILFYSINPSYKVIEQASGRIDRYNTKFTNLYYYYMISDAPIEQRFKRLVQEKKAFNLKAWAKEKKYEFGV